MNLIKLFLRKKKDSKFDPSGDGKACRLPGGFDWHCHILPGVDDGFQELGHSLRMLALYEEHGMREIWFTPHIMEDVPNEPEHLREVFAETEQAYLADFAQRHPEGGEPLKLHLAAENMLDALFEKRLKAGNLLPLGEHGDHLLVETSIFSAPMNFYGLMERIKNKGFTPVLAHPERYLYMEMEGYERLKKMGVKFQRNLFSLDGQYGKEVQKRCKQLLKKGMYDLVGSDLHHISTFERYW